MFFGSYSFCLHSVFLSFSTTIYNSNADALKSLAVQSLRNLEATRVMNRDEVAQELQEHEIYHQSPGTVAAGVGSVVHNVGGGGAHGVSGVSGVSGGGVKGAASVPQRSASPPTTSTTSGSGGNGSNGGTSPRRGTIVSSNAALWDVDNGSEDDI